jgi:hypothetical protein
MRLTAAQDTAYEKHKAELEAIREAIWDLVIALGGGDWEQDRAGQIGDAIFRVVVDLGPCLQPHEEARAAWLEEQREEPSDSELIEIKS